MFTVFHAAEGFSGCGFNGIGRHFAQQDKTAVVTATGQAITARREDGNRSVFQPVIAACAADIWEVQDWTAGFRKLLQHSITSSTNLKPTVALLKGGCQNCLLYTSDAADERSSVDLG